MYRSEQLFQQAQQLIPGGVNSPVRAFTHVGGTPPFIAAAEGVSLYDVDGRRYLDYLCSWGAIILGHNALTIREAVLQATQQGLSFGTPTEIEVAMARQITTLMPALEQVRMVNSGSEATMSAIRLARGYTKRNKIIKFAGGYHGHVDPLLAKAGSGPLALSQPDSAGIPPAVSQDTLIATYNDLDSVISCFNCYPEEIAAVIVEPVAGNMGCIPPIPQFLPGLRQLCDQFRAVLIFDEVITGFRIALGGAQAYYQVRPDLTCLGKIIGGGLPIGAFGGRSEIMAALAPHGPVYQAGTLSGNPIVMAAGHACLRALSENAEPKKLHHLTQKLAEGLLQCAQRAEVPIVVNHVPGMWSLFFTTEQQVMHQAAVLRCHHKRFQHFFHQMLARNIYLAPSAFESLFLSFTHTETHLEEMLQAAEESFTCCRAVN